MTYTQNYNHFIRVNCIVLVRIEIEHVVRNGVPASSTSGHIHEVVQSGLLLRVLCASLRAVAVAEAGAHNKHSEGNNQRENETEVW